MSIRKVGTPVKIDHIAKDAQAYQQLWESIEKKNQVVRCKTCGKLISKFDDASGQYTIKHHSLSAIVTGGKVTCPQCKTVNELGQTT